MKRICLPALIIFSFLWLNDLPAQVPSRAVWFPVYKDGQMGYMDSTGKLVIDCTLDPVPYYEMQNVTEEVFIAKHDEKYYIVNRQAKLVSETGYDKLVIDKKQKLIRAETGESSLMSGVAPQVSWLNYQGQQVNASSYPCGFFECGYYYYNNLWVITKDGKKGAVNLKGEMVIEPKYESLTDFTNGYAVFRYTKDGKCGLLSQNNKIMISPKYDEMSSATKAGDFFAMKNTPTGKLTVAVNIAGREVKPLGTLRIGYVYTRLAVDDNNTAIVQDTVTKLFGMVNYKGDILVKPKYNGFSFGLSEGLVAFNIGGTRGEDDAWNERTGGKWVVVNAAGKELCKPFAADKLEYFSEGLAPVQVNNKWGFVNANGVIVIRPQFEEKPGSFENGLCRIVKQSEDLDAPDGVGYINKKGVFVWEVGN